MTATENDYKNQNSFTTLVETSQAELDGLRRISRLARMLARDILVRRDLLDPARWDA